MSLQEDFGLRAVQTDCRDSKGIYESVGPFLIF